MFVKLLAIAAAAAVLVGTAVHPTSGSGPERIYVVRPGDTLWSIAVARYAGDPREAVWKLERRNGLSGSAFLRAGERLALPP